MTDEEALRATIAANPTDDMPRLVYADWLEEHGQPVRAEFIRVQCEIGQKQLLPRAMQDQYVGLYRRNQELLDNHREELLGPLAALPRELVIDFERGFAGRIQLRCVAFLRTAPIIAETKPLPKIEVTGVAGHLADFLRNPYLQCVSRIDAWPADEIPLSGLSELRDLPIPLLVATTEKLIRLESLHLAGCSIGDLHCDLASNLSLPALVELDLAYNEITDLGVINLLRTSFPAQLHTLNLGSNPITDWGATELANAWPREKRLKNLNLRFTLIGPQGQQALLNRFGGIVDLF